MNSSRSVLLAKLRRGARRWDKGGTTAPRAHFDDSEFFDVIADNTCDVIFYMKLKPYLHYEHVSPSATRITGYTPQEYYADPKLAAKCISAEDYKLLLNPALFRKGVKNRPIEVRWKRKDGRTIWTEHVISASHDAAGKPEAILIIARDITDRKKAEDDLLETQRFNASLLDNAPHAAVVINPDTSIRYVNPAWINLNGWTAEEVLGMKSPYPWWPDQFRQIFEDGFKEALKQPSGKGEIIAQKKNGEIYWIDMTWTAVNRDGALQYIVINSLDITERKRMEQALRESEETFSTAFHASPDSMAIINIKDATFIEVNDSYANALGYKREDLIGHTGNEFNLWADPADNDRMQKLIETQGKIRHEEFRFRTRTGGTCIWLCSLDVVNVKGAPCLLCVAADITERKRAEEALLESQEKFSKAFNASPTSISISRLRDGRFIEVNDSFLRDKGYTREEIIGQSSLNFKIWSSEAEEKRIMDVIKAGGHIKNEQVQYRTKAGHVRTGLVSAEVVSISNEPCMLVMNNDITQQKLAQEQLRLLSSVTEQVTDAIIITDPHFKVTYLNQAAQELFGYTLEEARGKSINLFNEKPVTAGVLHDRMEKMTREKVWTGVITKKHKDGRRIICDCRFSPLYDEKGQICSYIDVQRDITRQYDIEARLQEHKKLIDGMLATLPEGVLVLDSREQVILANKAFNGIFRIPAKTVMDRQLEEVLPAERFYDLHKAVKDTEAERHTLEFRYQQHGVDKIIACVVVKMDEDRRLLTFSDVSREREEEEKLYLTDRLASLGEMAAGLAHELNNPLTGILALSQMLMGSDIPADFKEDVACINSEAKRAAAIVKNVLLFARNKADAQGHASINETVTDILRLREYEEKAGNIKVVTRLEEDLPDIPIDKGQLQQVILNLLSNAEAAIKEAGRPGVITIGTQRVNHHVNISFSDNGCGIKKQIMNRIFDPFFTTKPVGKGTGLGLSICYSIIVKHGGKISVKSQVNEGTTFTIRMPVVGADRQARLPELPDNGGQEGK